MFIAVLTLLSALSISGVAIFYSVIGLATIFPGAFWPVVIMGSVLEVGKLVTASWLYRNWQFTKWLLRIYLTLAVIILSAITSMGIFGFLSKAHLEQNLAEDTVTQRIEIITNKISAENTYIERQKAVIERAENTLGRVTDSNTGALDIEIQGLKDAEDKFKTLLAVETNTVKDLNDRLRTLDKDVSDVLTANKQFFNEERAAAELKASQKEERDQIAADILAAQQRIQILKDDYAQSTNKIQQRIDSLRQSNVTDNSGVNADITKAEANILAAQNRIDDLILEREPLQSQMLKLEAEVGPVKYIAALAVDFGWTDSVNTSEAVRWVILIIIVVFDPLAVLLLIAANQSLIRRFPPEPPKPQTVIDLEKPDEEDVTLKWNDAMNKQDAAAKMEQATEQLKQWQEKLEKFNQRVPKPEDKPVEIIQEDDGTVPHIELNGQKKTEDEEIGVDKELQQMRFDRYDIQHEKKLLEVARKAREEDAFDPEEVKYDMETPQQPRDFLEEQAREDEITRLSMLESKRQAEERKAKEQDRIKPDLTEVIEPEVKIEEKKTPTMGTLGQRIVDNKGRVVEPPKPALKDPKSITDQERTAMLNLFHQQHGKFQDITDEELKMERDASNRAQYLADVSLSKEEAEKQGPITESRMKFFQDIIDDILRGDTTFENVPEENRKIIAQIMDPDLPDPEIITRGSALKPEGVPGIENTTAERLKEKFMAEPKTEERPMTDAELDQLLAGFEEEQKPTGKTKIIIKDGQRIMVPVEDEEGYIQNEEQNDQTLWNKTKELDIPEPEKNEIVLPELKTETEESIPVMVESIKVENKIPEEKFTNFRKRLTSEEEYHQRVEARINDLITKLERKEIVLSDLSDEDQKVIMDILNDNG